MYWRDSQDQKGYGVWHIWTSQATSRSWRLDSHRQYAMHVNAGFSLQPPSARHPVDKLRGVLTEGTGELFLGLPDHQDKKQEPARIWITRICPAGFCWSC